MNRFDEIMQALKEYTSNYSALGIIRVVIDLLLIVVSVYLLYRLLRVKFNNKRILLLLVGYGVVYLILYFFELTLSLKFIKFIGFWSVGLILIIFNQEIKHIIETSFKSMRSDNAFSTVEEKKEVINNIIKATTYLASKSIGALITIEREDSLNTIIDKAILIKAVVSEELLTTIFTVGTACHDGAVIIRKDKIMCAGAYLPSTDKYDIPKSLGTRHRAAIGLSERYDAITIVVSEETGKISLTHDGVIDIGISEERLTEVMSQYLEVK